MSDPGWRVARASVIGTSHLKTERPCQDVSTWQVLADELGDEVLVAVVADGAGSASRSLHGATVACSRILVEVQDVLLEQGSVRQIKPDHVIRWLLGFQMEISRQAIAQGLSHHDFACTLLIAVVGQESAVFSQIGDGGIVVGSAYTDDDYSWIFWPQKGEYENQTQFATSLDVESELVIEFVNHRIDEVALFSDGLQRLALHFESQSAHAPFFGPMFASMRSVADFNTAAASSSLEALLASPRINERTDDDKTLILATRLRHQPETCASAASRAPANVNIH